MSDKPTETEILLAQAVLSKQLHECRGGLHKESANCNFCDSDSCVEFWYNERPENLEELIEHEEGCPVVLAKQVMAKAIAGG